MTMIKVQVSVGDVFLNSNADAPEGKRAVMVVGTEPKDGSPLVVKDKEGRQCVVVKDMLAPSKFNGEIQEGVFKLPLMTLAIAGEKITMVQLAQLMHDYHIGQHFKTANEAIKKSENVFKYTTRKSILDEIERLGSIRDEKQNDIETKAFMNHFDTLKSKELSSKFVELTLKSIMEPEIYDPQLADFLLSIQKPSNEVLK